MSTQTIHGIGASSGIAIGPVFRYKMQEQRVEKRHVEDSAAEWACLEAALAQAKAEIQALASRAKQEVGTGSASIFEAHEMFLSDPDLLEQVRTTMETQHVNADYAWKEGTEQYAATLRSLSDEYLARAVHVEDVARQVLQLLHGAGEQVAPLQEPSIIVATELATSDTLTFDKQKVLALCTAYGGATAPVAFLAKKLGIAAVVRLGAAADQLHSGAQVIVNGITGEVLIEPDEAEIAVYRQQMQALAQSWSEALQEALAPAITADGKQVETVANIISPADAAGALEYGAEGVGLLRSEFLFLDRDTAPDEDEQFAVYSAIMETMGQRPVVIRTLDIGGAKPASYLDMPQEVNPSLGVRGVRFSLAHPEVFQVQLRALLRAGVGHNVKIMFPMVATREEVLAAREQLAAAREALTERGVPFSQQYEVGIMVEVPAAALMADVLAGMVDFFSIGTNDLSQYTLAADRRNAAVAPLADVLHPAVLRLIRMVIDAAHAQGKWVGLCGDLAGDPLAVSVLLGLGLDEFSMTARSLPAVKQAIRRCTLAQAREIALHALALGDASEVRGFLHHQLDLERPSQL
ncbi:MAG TPA: phosphoenolpyruvate--protein phosphotransferase [Ktedonobacteraceae bacterium]